MRTSAAGTGWTLGLRAPAAPTCLHMYEACAVAYAICHMRSSPLSQYAALHAQRQLEAELASLEYRLSDRNLTLLPEYEQRLAVLTRLGYVDAAGSIQLKGRVACEVGAQLQHQAPLSVHPRTWVRPAHRSTRRTRCS
jgi:hypothetical protein